MNISNYTAFFHDGSLLEIKHENDKIILSMSSAEMDEEDLKEPIELSNNDRIVGKLHIEGVKNIIVDDERLEESLQKEYDDGQIFHFEIVNNKVNLEIIWGNYPPNPEVDVFSEIAIEGEKIYWENIPDLEDGL